MTATSTSQISWYSPNSAADAIASARNNNNATLILVEEPEERKFDDVLSDSQIVSFLNERFSCLRLHKGDQVTDQFIDLVPVDLFPSLFIFFDGKLRETVQNTDIAQGEFLTRLEAIFDPTKKVTVTKKASPSLSEKKALLLEKIEEKRLLKAQQEQECQKIKEMERRQSTKQLQEAKIQKQEREAKLLQENKIREKREAAEHRLKVQAQIAQDKAERAALRQKNKSESPSTCSPTSKAENKTSSSSHNTCRLSLRMEDGSQHRVSFNPDVALQEVRDYVKDKLLTEDYPFHLMLTVPRYKFTSEDTSRSLRELELGSSNTLLVKVVKPVSTGAAASDMFSSLMTWSFTSIQQLVTHLTALVFSSSTQNAIASSSNTQSSSSNSRNTSNVITLHSQPKDDKPETRTTDNGNSTQQQ